VLLLSSLGSAVSIFAAPSSDLWPFWQSGQATTSVSIDHTLWQQLLDQHLKTGADGITRFAYRAVTPEGEQLLQQYLEALANIDPRSHTTNEQLAYWINLYNALTVSVVLQHPDSNSIRDMGGSFFNPGPWNEPLITVVGQALTLNDIEHRILRPIWRDRRIHYAVNCASLGCPNLRSQAYQADTIDAQLTSAEHEFINHPRAVSFDEQGHLSLSELFSWYSEDFAPDQTALLNYLSEHHDTLSQELTTYRGRIRYQYDWRLNQVSTMQQTAR